MKKIQQITDKLVEAGFVKQDIEKPDEEWFKSDASNLRSDLTEITGDADIAKALSDKYLKKIYDECVSDISFISDNFNVEFYFDKAVIKVHAMGKGHEIKLQSETLTAYEVIPFKEISIDDFYRLFVERGFDINLIFNNGDN